MVMENQAIRVFYFELIEDQGGGVYISDTANTVQDAVQELESLYYDQLQHVVEYQKAIKERHESTSTPDR